MPIPVAFRRILKNLFRIFVAVFLLVVIALLFFQSKLIYHGRPYSVIPERRNAELVLLHYSTSQGSQQSYYLPPRQLPRRKLWVMFCGNASLALDWLNFIDPPPDSHDGYLMVEYPGYGNCQGWASPEHIEEGAEAAFATLAETQQVRPAELEKNLNLLCLSIGCATGLNFAVHHPVRQVILMAPFTNLRAMARRAVGWPLCYLLLHNYDNAARLGELAARANPPKVDIFHGSADPLIPPAMGKSLADLYPQMVAFHEVPDATHNSIVTDAADAVREKMKQD